MTAIGMADGRGLLSTVELHRLSAFDEGTLSNAVVLIDELYSLGVLSGVMTVRLSVHRDDMAAAARAKASR